MKKYQFSLAALFIVVTILGLLLPLIARVFKEKRINVILKSTIDGSEIMLNDVPLGVREVKMSQERFKTLLPNWQADETINLITWAQHPNGVLLRSSGDVIWLRESNNSQRFVTADTPWGLGIGAIRHVEDTRNSGADLVVELDPVSRKKSYNPSWPRFGDWNLSLENSEIVVNATIFIPNGVNVSRVGLRIGEFKRTDDSYLELECDSTTAQMRRISGRVASPNKPGYYRVLVFCDYTSSELNMPVNHVITEDTKLVLVP